MKCIWTVRAIGNTAAGLFFALRFSALARKFVPTAGAENIEALFEAASEPVMSRPHDLVLGPDGRVYVADLGNDRVVVLHPDTLQVLSSFGENELNSPHDVAFDAAGRLMVADTGNDRVVVFDLGGAKPLLVESLSESLSGPEGVSQASDGRIYVVNASSDSISVFQAGKLILVAGEWGSEPRQFDRPHDIHVREDGSVVAADPGNNRLQVLTPELEYIDSLAGLGYDFHEPKYFDIDARGWLFVADEYNHKIKILTPQNELVASIGSGGAGEGPNLFNFPEGVEVRGSQMWVSDTRNHRVVRYRIQGLPD